MPIPSSALQPRLFFIAATFIIIFILSYWILPIGSNKIPYEVPYEVPYEIPQTPFPAGQMVARRDASNATLGFHKLLALSVRPSWRTRGLQAAANLTGLSIDIPHQPHNPDAFIDAFREIGAGREGVVTPTLGSARAWVAHLDLLKYVVSSGLSSAFILEDDVDWDVRIKEQMRLLSDHIRAYTHTAPEDPAPFGGGWDVLWLGHCGATVDDEGSPVIGYFDDSRCPTEMYVSWTTAFVAAYVPKDHRVIQHAGQATVCTFGYGVTALGAQKVISAVGAGAGEAFDVHLSTRCREGALRCLVVNPQLFHHYEPNPNDGGGTSIIHVADGDQREADESAFEKRPGSTANIVRSARCRALFGTMCLRLPSGVVTSGSKV
ncbi:glycosyltransferase family 25 protein [Nemania sp. FL0031]|nr:glycosyltransferase family 25 protein [Nemania sp. FL0031]